MENKNIAMLVAAFLAIIVGVSLVGVVASTGNELTNVINIDDEIIDYSGARQANGTINVTYPITISSPPTTWRITGCPIIDLVLSNSTTTLTDVDYNFTASTGVILFKNSANVNTTGAWDNTTNATYQYCPIQYLTQGWNRTIINLVPGFFALALLGVGIGLFYVIMKNEGILGI